MYISFDGFSFWYTVSYHVIYVGWFVQDDGSPVSIFALSGNNAQDGHLAAGRNGVKRLRTVSSLFTLSLSLSYSSLLTYGNFYIGSIISPPNQFLFCRWGIQIYFLFFTAPRLKLTMVLLPRLPSTLSLSLLCPSQIRLRSLAWNPLRGIWFWTLLMSITE